MNAERDLDRVRATYADLLDHDEGDDLPQFIGALEAVHATPPLPAAVQAALDRPVWEATGLPPRPDSRQRRRHRRLSWSPARGTSGTPITPLPAPPSPWTRMSQVINTATTVALIVGIALASVLLLRDRATPGQGVATAEGNWLYPGSLEGRSGIISVGADGVARLLIEGGFSGVTPSPDGQRLLAYGNTDPGIWTEPATAAALYTRDGQLLQRYTLGGAAPILPHWAPDSRHVAFSAWDGLAISGMRNYEVWLLDEVGEREVRLGERAGLGTATGGRVWSSRGQFLVDVALGDTNGDGQVRGDDDHALWTVNTNGDASRQLYRGVFIALGWSRDGETAYLIEASRLLALDANTGAERTVAHFADVKTKLRPAPMTSSGTNALDDITGFSFSAAAIAPSSDRFAIWLIPNKIGSGIIADTAAHLAIIDDKGQILSQTLEEPNSQPQFVAWSPDGARLAYSLMNISSGKGGVRVVSGTGTPLATTPLAIGETSGRGIDWGSLRWSADSRQLAYFRSGRITIASGESLAERQLLPGVSSGWPSWQQSPAR